MLKTTPSPKKALHVGVIREGRFVEDRWFLEERPITVGTAAKNTFPLPLSTLAASQPLFTRNKNGQLLLHVDENARGKITIDGRDHELGDMRRNGLAIANAGTFEIPLTDSMRGRVTLGETTFVFNFSSAPPKPQTPKLPKEIRCTLWNITDHTFMSVLGLSVVFHTFALGTISRRELPPEDPVIDYLDDFGHFHRDVPPPEEVTPPVAKLKIAPVVKVSTTETTRAPPKDSLEHKLDVQRRVADTGLIHVIGALSGSSGALGNVFATNDKFSDDISAALSGATSLAIASTGAVPMRRGEDSGRAAQIGSVIGTSGVGRVRTHEKTEVEVTGGVHVEETEIDSPTVDKDALARFIKLHLPSVKACYETQLKRSPTLRGKLVMRFTIGTNGRATDVLTDSNSMGSDEVEACIIRTIKSWLFPFKPDADTTVSFPFVFAPAN